MGEQSRDARRPLTAAIASIGAGIIHAGAVGIHAEHRSLVFLFAWIALLQVGGGVLALERPARAVLAAGVAVNALSVAGWFLTRTVGIVFIAGLEEAEKPQAADSICALLGLVAALGLWAALVAPDRKRRLEWLPLVAVVGLTAGGLAMVREHSHSHAEESAVADSAFVIGPNGELVLKSTTTVSVGASSVAEPQSVGAASGGTNVAETGTTVAVPGTSGPSTVASTAPRATTTTVATTTSTEHTHVTTPAAVLAAASGWPRVWDPTNGLDLMSNVGGVTAEQESRAKNLVSASLRDLPKWADYSTAVAAGWKSIGDNQTTGFEHLVNSSLVNDGKFLDTSAPESLVYRVDGTTKTLVSAMFIAPTGTSITDPLLTEYAGPLMQWHIHNNLCFRINAAGNPVVAALTNAAGSCPLGTFKQTNGSPMVHVWITPHPCGPFAAVEGVAAGTAAVPDSQRLDLCSH